MDSTLANLKPKLLWKYFDAICSIPHCSKNEEALGARLLETARELGYEARQDEAGNVVVVKPATPGNENAPGVVLQGHLDMVCEKNSDTRHDFDKDPIRVRTEGEWLTAEGTTLGADNGVGVAAGMALLEEDNLEHGPLELLFTVDEETGLNGALSLQPDFLKGRILLNLDSEEEGAFFIGCAGGADSEITLPVKRDASAKGDTLSLKLAGLRGGHSGLDIHTGRGNAVQLLGRMLDEADVDYRLIGLEGGSKHNAIPREAEAQVMVAPADRDAFVRSLKKRFEAVKFEYKAVETGMRFEAEKTGSAPMAAMTPESTRTFIALLIGLPHGVSAMSQEIPDLVETSDNLAIVKTLDDKATFYLSTRSSIPSALEALRKRIEALADLAGGTIEQYEGYPPWTPNLDSPLLKTMKSIYKDINGEEPKVLAIHAGLECGIIGDRYPGMDMISFGPDLKNPHSPDEKVHIASVERFYELIKSTLKALA